MGSAAVGAVTALLALTAAVLLDEQVQWAVTNQAKAATILESLWLGATRPGGGGRSKKLQLGTRRRRC